MSRITALICAYNASETIQRAILSVAGQVDEIIIIDDSSTDSTVEEITFLNNSKISLIKSPQNKGIGAARHLALEQCQTQYAIWVDADDECFPNRVSTLLPYLEKGAGWVYDSVELYDGQSGSFSKNLLIPKFLFESDGLFHQFARNYIPSIGFPMINVEQARKIGFDVTFRHGEDYDHLLRALSSGGKVSLSPNVTHRMYEYQTSLSRQLDGQNRFVELAMKKVKYNTLMDLLTTSSLKPNEQLSIILMRLLKLKDEYGLKQILTALPLPTATENEDFDWLVCFAKGMHKYFDGDYPSSLIYFQGALVINASADVCNNIGVLKELIGEGGRDFFAQALELFPGYQDAEMNLKSKQMHLTYVPLRSYESRNQYHEV